MQHGERESSPRSTHGRSEQGVHRGDGTATEVEPIGCVQLTAACIKPVTYKYLWRPWLPLGHLALVEGDEGVGKSLFLARVVADVTGGPRIDGGRRRRPGRWALYLAGEESLAGSVVPRLAAAGADLGKVSFGPAAGANGRCWRPELPRDLHRVEALLKQLRPGALVLEPVVSFFGREVDWRRDQDAHAVLDPLVLLAADYDCALIGARHWTKAASGPALARGMGSRAVSGCAAVVIQLGRQESREGGFAAVCPKNRLGPPIEARSYSIQPVQAGAVLKFGAPLGLRVDDLQRATSLGSAQKMLAARILLRGKLTGPWVPASEIVAAAKKDGISDTVLYEAKALDKVRNRWNTATEPKRAEWAAPTGGFKALE